MMGLKFIQHSCCKCGGVFTVRQDKLRDGVRCVCGGPLIVESITSHDGRKENNLLEIRLNREKSVPKVFYKGEEITGKVKVNFDWETQTDEFGGMKYHVGYLDEKTEYPNKKTIALETGRMQTKRIDGTACQSVEEKIKGKLNYILDNLDDKKNEGYKMSVIRSVADINAMIKLN